ncbi:hypothetical protein HK102_001126 [Quaeritorhiza haematococci]|nr:hypothetical protein HK102_001126 [Quaeritorhiza haematococci]
MAQDGDHKGSENGTGVTTAVDYIRQQDELIKEASEVLPGAIDNAIPLMMSRNSSIKGEIHPPLLTDEALHHAKLRSDRFYQNRHFRCDCGTARMKGPCSLEKKDEETKNTENSYNHNFDGLFCWQVSAPIYAKSMM